MDDSDTKSDSRQQLFFSEVMGTQLQIQVHGPRQFLKSIGGITS